MAATNLGSALFPGAFFPKAIGNKRMLISIFIYNDQLYYLGIYFFSES